MIFQLRRVSPTRVLPCDFIMSLNLTQVQHEIEDICSKEELVTFKTTQLLYPPGNDLSIGFTLGSRVSATPHDWIGIFQSGWQDTSHPLALKWAPPRPPKATKPKERFVTFQSKDIQPIKDPSKSYQFLYINNANQVLGVSKQFMVKEEETWDLDMEVYNTMTTQSPEVLSSSELIGKEDAATANSESPVVVSSSDEEWEIASQNALKREDISTSDLSDIEILPSSPSKEAAKLNLRALAQCDKNELDALLSFSFSSEDNSSDSSNGEGNQAPGQNSKTESANLKTGDIKNDKELVNLESPVTENNDNSITKVPTLKFVKKKKEEKLQNTLSTCLDTKVKEAANREVKENDAKVSDKEVTPPPQQKSMSKALFEQLRIVDFDDASDGEQHKSIMHEGKNVEKNYKKIVEVVSKEDKDENEIMRRNLSKEKGAAILMESKFKKAKRKKNRLVEEDEEKESSNSKQKDCFENKTPIVENCEGEQNREKQAVLFDEMNNDLERARALSVISQSKERKSKKKCEKKPNISEAEPSSQKDTNVETLGFQTEELSCNAKRNLEKEVRYLERKSKIISKKSQQGFDSGVNGLVDCAGSGQNDSGELPSGEELRAIRKKYVHNQKIKNKKKKRMQAKHCDFSLLFNGLSNDEQTASKSDLHQINQNPNEEPDNSFLQDTSDKGFPALPCLKPQGGTHPQNQPDLCQEPSSHDPTQSVSKENSTEESECDNAKESSSPTSSLLNSYVPAYLLDVIDALPPASSGPDGRSLVEWKQAVLPMVAKVSLSSFKAKYKAKYARKQEMNSLKSRRKNVGLSSGIIDRIKTQLMNYGETNQEIGLMQTRAVSKPEPAIASTLSPPLSNTLGTQEPVLPTKGFCDGGNTLTYASVVKKHTEEKELTSELYTATNECNESLKNCMETPSPDDGKTKCVTEESPPDILQNILLDATIPSDGESNSSTFPHVCNTKATKVVSQKWKKAHDAENARLKEVQDKLRQCSIKPEKEETPLNDLQTDQHDLEYKLGSQKIDNQSVKESKQVPCLVNIPSSFGSWVPQFALTKETWTKIPTEKDEENKNEPLLVEDGLHLRPMARIHSNGSFLSSSSPPKIPKGVVKNYEKHSLEPNMEDDLNQQLQTDVLNPTTISTHSETKDLKDLLNEPELKDKNTIKDQDENEVQRSKVAKLIEYDDTVRNIRYKKLRTMKWAGKVKTLIRTDVQIMNLKSKIKATDNELRSLENKVNALQEALEAETKKTSKANLKWLKMKVKIKEMKAKLKEKEHIVEEKDIESVQSREEDFSVEESEPPNKKRRIEAEEYENERLECAPAKEHFEHRTEDEMSVAFKNHFPVPSNISSSKQSLGQFYPSQTTDLNASPSFFRGASPEAKLSGTFCPLGYMPGSDSHLFPQRPSPNSRSYHTGFSKASAGSSCLLPLGPYVHPRQPLLTTDQHQYYHHPSYINNHQQYQKQSTQRYAPPLLPLSVQMHSSPPPAYQHNRASQPMPCLLQTPASSIDPHQSFQKNPKRNSPPHLPLPTPSYTLMSFNNSGNRSREKSTSPPRLHCFPSQSSKNGNRDKIHHRVDSPPRPVVRTNRMGPAMDNSRRHCLNPYQSYHGGLAPFPEAEPFTAHIHDSHLCWSSNGAPIINESGRQPASIDSCPSHSSVAQGQGRLNAKTGTIPSRMKQDVSDRITDDKALSPTSLSSNTSATPPWEDMTAYEQRNREYPAHYKYTQNNKSITHKKEEPMDEDVDHQVLNSSFYGFENVPSATALQTSNPPNAHFQSRFLRQLLKDETDLQQYGSDKQEDTVQLQQQLRLPNSQQLPPYFFPETESHDIPFAQDRQHTPYRLFQGDSCQNEYDLSMKYTPLHEDYTNMPTFHNEQHHFYQHRPPLPGELPVPQSTGGLKGKRYSTSSQQDAGEDVASFQNTKSTVELNVHGLVGGFRDDSRLTPGNLVEKRLIEASTANHSNRLE